MRIDPERHDPVQIVHVHGTYWFYDCCNLKDELLERSSVSDKTTATMASLLDRILAKRSPLVVGYSGWEDDVIMSALKRRLEDQSLAYRLYWFCYRITDYELLPSWLKDHRDVRIITPNGTADVLTSGQSESTLSAQTVMDAFIQGFSLPSPKLTTDPLTFYADQLTLSVIHENDESLGDLYGISSLISRIAHARDLEKVHRATTEESLEQIRDSLRRSAYPEVIALALKLDACHLSPQQGEDLMQAIDSSIKPSLITTSVAGLTDACDLLLRMALDANERSSSEKLQFRIANAIYAKGYHTLTILKNPDLAMAILEELVNRFNSEKTALKRYAAIGNYYIGISYQHQGNITAALEAFENVINDFNHQGVPGWDMAVWAMLRKSEILIDQKNFNEVDKIVADIKSLTTSVSDPLITALETQIINLELRLRLSKHKFNQEKDEIKKAAIAQNLTELLKQRNAQPESVAQKTEEK